MEAIRHHFPRFSERKCDHFVAAGWAAIIYATVPLVRTFQGWYAERFHKVWITVFVLLAIVALLIFVVLRLRRTRRRFEPTDLIWLGGVACASGWLTWQLRHRPEEAIHLLEYSILAMLVFRAVRPREPNLAVLLAAVLLTTIMGAVDEVIQWITPDRFFDYRDIGLNAVAGFLAAIVVWRMAAGPWRKPDVASIRLVLRAGATLIVLLALCLANTPDVVAWYASRVPGLEFLSHPANEMAEYGYRHRVPGVGVFMSRLTTKELLAEDRLRGEAVGEILAKYPDTAYSRFIREYQGYQDPLLYEARIHIFSRDYLSRLAQQAVPGSRSHTEYSSRAFGEQLLIERFFAVSSTSAGFALSQNQRRALESARDPEWEITSRAGSHLITRLTEIELRTLLLTLAAVFVILDLVLGVRYPRIGASQ